MNRIALSLSVYLLATTAVAAPPDGAALSTGASAPAPSAPARAVRGKPSAPVQVEAKLDPAAGTGQVTVRFESAGSDLELTVRGLDGMRVTSPTGPTAAQTVSQGEVRTLDVTFTPGEGRSQLVVSVSGRFPSGRRASVATFAVGEPSAQQKARPGKVVVDSEGNRLRL